VGLSDRFDGTPPLEQRMDDLRAVMDAVGCERATLLGESEGAPMSLLFAATYPERTQALVLLGGFARFLRAADHPWAPTMEEHERLIEWVEQVWGQGLAFGFGGYPHLVGDDRMREWFARYERFSASPGDIVALMRLNAQIDVRHVLPSICGPTLLLHRTGDPFMSVEYSRYLAAHIAGARLVELPGNLHSGFYEDAVEEIDEIEAFLTGVRRGPELDRVLATVLFTDIVSSTEHAFRVSDAQWRSLLDRHDQIAERQIEQFRGRPVSRTMGDGVIATFDGPARAIRCAEALRDSVAALGLEMRAGLHTGEIELRAGDIGGIAVHIAQRVSAEAGPGEVLVSSTVKDLVAGSGIGFVDRGIHVLKGVPDEWRLFAAEG